MTSVSPCSLWGRSACFANSPAVTLTHVLPTTLLSKSRLLSRARHQMASTARQRTSRWLIRAGLWYRWCHWEGRRGPSFTADDCSEGIRAVTATEVTFSERRRRLKFFLRLGFLVFNLIIILPGKKHPSFLDAIRLRYSYSYHWYESKESHNFKLRLVIQFIEKKWLELENR